MIALGIMFNSGGLKAFIKSIKEAGKSLILIKENIDKICAFPINCHNRDNPFLLVITVINANPNKDAETIKIILTLEDIDSIFPYKN